MKNLIFLPIFFFVTVSSLAQSSTEVYLFDLTETEKGLSVSNPVNISNNEGYDNQPSFTEDGKSVLFSSTRNGQTDIVWYDIETGTKKWISDTPGGEYSPVLMPDGKYISAVRLDPDGLQLLYKYSIEDGSSDVLIHELKIGYYAWFLRPKLIAFVLGEPATLQEIDLNTGEATIMYQNPGRSIHYIPGSKKYSFIDKSNSDDWKIMQAVSGNAKWTTKITSTLEKSEDMVWINMHTIIMGKDDQLYFFDTRRQAKGWQLFADFSIYKLTGITRLAFNSGKLAVVVDGK